MASTHGLHVTGKHYRWHTAWRRDADGRLAHTSGLRVLTARSDGFTDYEVDPATLEVFQAAERARGVPLHDILARLKRLIKEAQEWHQHNP